MSMQSATLSPNVNIGQNVSQGKEGNAWHEFDILAAVVSRYQNAAPKKPQSPEHRISCHRCGNIRKRRILCTRATCPHTFCGRCAEKMKEEHGLDVFFGGCPVCKELCCCNNKSVFCHRKNHCYRKCPATKTNGKQSNLTMKEDSDGDHYHEELSSIPKPESGGQYGIFDLLAAVADMDKSQAMGKVPKMTLGAPSSSSAPAAAPRKKAKVSKDGTVGGKDMYGSNMLLCEPSFSQYFSSSASGVPESVGNMQLLNSKDSGVDGYTFNNNTMGIIRGGMGGVTDALALMGQQPPQKPKGTSKFHVGMGVMGTSDALLSTLSAPIGSTVGASSSSSASGSAGAASGTAPVPAATANGSAAPNRLPSIDNNPFSGAAALAPRDTPTFDQALLDSVRNIQPDGAARLAAKPADAVPAASAAAPSAAGKADSKNSDSATGGMEPMNLLALVSSFSSSLDKSKQVLPAEHLLLPPGAVPAGTGAGDHTAKK